MAFIKPEQSSKTYDNNLTDILNENDIIAEKSFEEKYEQARQDDLDGEEFKKNFPLEDDLER